MIFENVIVQIVALINLENSLEQEWRIVRNKDIVFELQRKLYAQENYNDVCPRNWKRKKVLKN